MMGSNYQQDVNLLNLFSDVAFYNNMINSPEAEPRFPSEALVISQYLLMFKKKRLGGKYTKHKVAGHTSDLLFYPNTVPTASSIQKVANV
jgi:pyruvate dehydrogenase (quinone)